MNRPSSLSVLAFVSLDLITHWSKSSMASRLDAPAALSESPSLVRVYGARAYKWRGAFGIHTWIATKRYKESHYRIYQVIGWNLYRGSSAVSVSCVDRPDFSWFSARPELLTEHRDPGAEGLIDRIEAAVAIYPYPDNYRIWPGPNSNSFTAYVALR